VVLAPLRPAAILPSIDTRPAAVVPRWPGAGGTSDPMKTPLVPIALFLALVASVLAALPLAGTAFLSLSLFGFMLSLGGLAWFVISTDLAMDPLQRLKRASERFEESWPSFVQDFWAHVASVEARRD
jgi:hypothetical protein